MGAAILTAMNREKTFAASLAIAAFCAGASRAAESARDSAADALAGHRAEMRQWTGEDDPLRRPLFFDPADIESAPAGVPCDHVADRRPETVAGQGAVVLLRAPDGRTIRYWAPPPTPAALADIDRQARDFAAARVGNVDFALVGRRIFSWCR